MVDDNVVTRCVILLMIAWRGAIALLMISTTRSFIILTLFLGSQVSANAAPDAESPLVPAAESCATNFPDGLTAFQLDFPSPNTGATLRFEGFIYNAKLARGEGPSDPTRVIYQFPSLGRNIEDIPQGPAFIKIRERLDREKDPPLLVAVSLGPFWIAAPGLSNRALLSVPHLVLYPLQLHAALQEIERNFLPVVKKRSRSLFAGSLGALSAFHLAMTEPNTYESVALYALPDFLSYPVQLNAQLPWKNQKAWSIPQMASLFEAIDNQKDARSLLAFLFADSNSWVLASPFFRFVNGRPGPTRNLKIFLCTGVKDEFGFHQANQGLSHHMNERGHLVEWRSLVDLGHDVPWNDMFDFLLK